MVFPESEPQPGGPRQKGKTVAVGLGAVALVLGAVGIGAMTSPGPVAAATTTTSTSVAAPDTPIDPKDFTIDQIAMGDPLDWEETKSIVEGIPIGLTGHDGSIYLFATPSTTSGLPGSGGLRVWRSDDGTAWEYLGEGIPPGHGITAVASTERGLMAASSGIDGHGLVLWQSSDGVNWEPETIPIEQDSLARINFSTVAANDQAVVVGFYRDLDIARLIEERMAFPGVETAVTYWGWGVDDVEGGPLFTLWGPFGFPLAEMTTEDLELTDTEIEQVQRWNRGEVSWSGIWARDSAGVWTESGIPDAEWIDSIATTTAGVFLANGGDATGNTAWTSLDGVTWEEMSYDLRPYRIATWGDRLVGPTVMNRASVLASSDGETWSDIGPGDLFPSSLQWTMDNLAAGHSGIVGTVTGWSQESPVDVEPIPPPTLRDGGAVLTFDYDTSQLTLVAGTEVYTWAMHGSVVPDGLEVDLTTGDLSFSDPETGVPLARFGLDEIQSAEQSYWSRGWSGNETPLWSSLQMGRPGRSRTRFRVSGRTTWYTTWRSATRRLS